MQELIKLIIELAELSSRKPTYNEIKNALKLINENGEAIKECSKLQGQPVPDELLLSIPNELRVSLLLSLALTLVEFHRERARDFVLKKHLSELTARSKSHLN